MSAPVPSTDSDSRPQAGAPESGYREVRYRYSRQLVPLLEQLRLSVLVSTYAAGKLVALGTAGGQLRLSFHNFEQAMGIAARPSALAVGARGQVWLLKSGAELAGRLEPAGTFDACYLARVSYITGDVHGHELAWGEDGLWLVNTLFSCLCTVDENYSFVPRWRPPFITELRAEDRCHLNGMAMEGGQPRYVTMLGESNEAAGWRPEKAQGGCVMEVASGQVVCRGLAMPHSPRLHQQHLWVLNSGHGTLDRIDLRSGRGETVARVPGYARGLALVGSVAVVGLSRIRETAVFGGVPIAGLGEELRCGVAFIDLRSGRTLAHLEFVTGVEEIFDVQVLPGIRCVSITGPFPHQDDASDVWIVKAPEESGGHRGSVHG